MAQFKLFDTDLHWVISEKKHGNMSFFHDDINQVIANRDKFFMSHLPSSTGLAIMQVNHGNGIKLVNDADVGRGVSDLESAIPVDGLITSSSQISLGLLTADCLPLVFYDQLHKVLGLAHCGWKNLDINFVSTFVDTLVSVGATADSMKVGIGPAIHKVSYIKKNPDQLQDKKWQPWLTSVNQDTYSIDLIGFAHQQLLDSGIHREHIYITTIDTYTSNEYFSHALANADNEVTNGRFLTVVTMS